MMKETEFKAERTHEVRSLTGDPHDSLDSKD